ncbi:hypothetical protein ADK52_14260 [Streptomyces sp. WM6372]|uniref:hypothetical protein n=1 Tax=Streptomyces sp. WM6372 TaxID=1415555 RepID=UPI0006ADD399|nr:hypothetical protein [Streptomyces sp. WM6372]KOU24253.1 hypothetical protein ADK52_14260 [Streptomyces sp. WM6372]
MAEEVNGVALEAESDVGVDGGGDTFFGNLRPGVALRQEALAAGIRPEAVYHRRRADCAFALRTDRQRIAQ